MPTLDIRARPLNRCRIRFGEFCICLFHSHMQERERTVSLYGLFSVGWAAGGGSQQGPSGSDGQQMGPRRSRAARPSCSGSSTPRGALRMSARGRGARGQPQPEARPPKPHRGVLGIYMYMNTLRLEIPLVAHTVPRVECRTFFSHSGAFANSP